MRVAVVAVMFWGSAALAQGTPQPARSNEELFQQGVAALDRGSVTSAVDAFELLSDRGVVDANASFNRGVAYLRRAATPGTKPGDLGNATAAFTEVLRLHPEDANAEQLLTGVLAEIARRHLRAGLTPVQVHDSLWRAVSGWAAEDVWAILAGIASGICTVGLLLRFWARPATARFAGTLSCVAGALGLCVFGGLTWLSSHYRETSALSVVVAHQARLLDATGKPVSAQLKLEHQAIPEGASVHILERSTDPQRNGDPERSGHLVHVEWGDTTAWVEASQVRRLASP